MKELEVKEKEIKKFAVLLSSILFIISVFFIVRGNDFVSLILIPLGLLNIIISIKNPSIIVPLYTLWIKIGFLIGKVINPIVLGIIFFCIITPTAIFIKLLGRDELRLKMSHEDTDWIERKDDLQKSF